MSSKTVYLSPFSLCLSHSSVLGSHENLFAYIYKFTTRTHMTTLSRSLSAYECIQDLFAKIAVEYYSPPIFNISYTVFCFHVHMGERRVKWNRFSKRKTKKNPVMYIFLNYILKKYTCLYAFMYIFFHFFLI